MNGFILASTEGHSGKTITTLALLTAFYRNNVPVDLFKSGPDFIDPLLHHHLIGQKIYNLDTWLMGSACALKSFAENSRNDHLQLIEGNGGLFDGYDGNTEEGSTAHLAKTLGIPVVLVVNTSNSTNTVAAIVHSIKHFDPQVKVAGVILNFVRNDRHKKHLMDALAKVGIKVFGCIPLEDNLYIRQDLEYLLQMPDYGLNRKVVEKLNEIGACNFDLEGLSKLEYVNTYIKDHSQDIEPVEGHPIIAVAKDEAFNFYYQENLDLFEKLGAQIIEFSPLNANRLPEGTSAVYIGGGNCSFYSDLLEGNGPLRIEIKRLSQCGLPIFAESAGVLYLSKALTHGRFRRTLASVFDFEVAALPEIKNNGYVEVEVTPENTLFPTGTIFRGVQIKVAEIQNNKRNLKNIERPFLINNYEQSGSVGRIYLNTIASSAHIHFAANPEGAKQFVEAALAFQEFQRASTN